MDAQTPTEKELLDGLLDQLLKNYKKPEEILGEQGLLKRLSKAVLERALGGELTDHLGYEKHDPTGYGSGNSRNGTTEKTLKGKNGEVKIDVPRDRKGTFEPQIVKKHQTRFDGFDDKILSMYARGMTTRDIQGHLEEIYGVEVSPALISNVTDAVVEEVKAWQSRPLDAVYPILYLDALHVKIREAGHVQNRAIYVALGVQLEGHKEVLGLWAGQAEGAKFWLQVVTELKNRGVQDIFIACVDGLKGLPQAIETVFPKAQVQLCIVHLVRNSLNYVSWKERKAVAADLKPIYGAATSDDAWQRLEAFAEKWDGRYPSISQIWRRNWDQVSPFFGYPAEIRKVICTTNAVESLNMSLRKVIKTRGSFPNEEAALKLLYLGLERAAKKWTRPVLDWKAALNRFAILYEDRLPRGVA
ncbi:MAG TPA: IS256 family transposase [Terriglobia bacterium]|nr:IS256 family transposase [Terriglobia bacterium]